MAQEPGEERAKTYVLGISIGVVEPVRPVNDIGGLFAVLQEVLVCGLVDLLDLIAAEGDGLDGPVAVLDVEDLGGDGGDDAVVMAGTLDGPPEVRAGVNAGQSAVGKDDVHRLKLVGNQTMVALKPTVATTESRAQVADTFTGSGH